MALGACSILPEMPHPRNGVHPRVAPIRSLPATSGQGGAPQGIILNNCQVLKFLTSTSPLPLLIYLYLKAYRLPRCPRLPCHPHQVNLSSIKALLPSPLRTLQPLFLTYQTIWKRKKLHVRDTMANMLNGYELLSTLDTLEMIFLVLWSFKLVKINIEVGYMLYLSMV